MVKHIILWKLKETDPTAAAKIKADAKRELEALNGKIDGLLSIKVVTDALASSNADMMLDSCFESAEALAGYQIHPLHKAAANGYVRPFVEVRLCLDFEE
ncbi:MAG: Dabb family protein [Clostridia bacterium]|nr:Dabb family protein [Clostridia bacterium]